MGKMVLISSVAKGNGAKHIAANLAQETAKKFEKASENNKVLLIDFDLFNPVLYNQLLQGSSKDEVKNINTGIDTVIEKKELNLLTDEGFVNSCIKINNGIKNPIYLLRGTNYPGRYKIYQREDIENILYFARNNFDHIFVVADSVHNNAGFTYSLTYANQMILVAKNNFTNLMRLTYVTSLITQYYSYSSPLKLIYNYGYNEKCDINDWLLNQEFNVEFLGVLEYEPEAMDNQNIFKKNFFAKKANKSIYKTIVGKYI